MIRTKTPDLVPVLSRGKHRSPDKGACFMEFASFLAGERWNDHPECTHPLLAGVARGVNDHISDTGRARLVSLIPSVVGLTGNDPAVDAGIAMRCASLALPVVSADRQRALAAGLLTARRFLTHQPSPLVEIGDLLDHAEAALTRAPHASRWAEEFVAGRYVSAKAFRRRSAPVMVRVSVIGIAEACIPDPDSLLHQLLDTVIRDCTNWLGPVTSKSVSRVFRSRSSSRISA